MWVLNLGAPVKVAKLDEEQAIEQGAQILGEVVIFGIAAACLVADYIRSSRKETAKEAAHQARLHVMENNIQELGIISAEQDAQIKELTRAVMALKPKNIKVSDYVPHEIKLDFKRDESSSVIQISPAVDPSKSQPAPDSKREKK